jgi:hypothetical protein
MNTTKADGETPKRGVLLRVQNGDVIGFDETGVRINLADSVIADIQTRLDQPGSAHLVDTKVVDASVLGDINAWDVKEVDGWYLFQARLPGAQNDGQFRRLVHAVADNFPCIIAQPSAALYGVLALGGARRGMTCDTPVRFPYHLLSTDDDMGAAGPAGTQQVEENDRLARLTEQTRDSLIGDEIIARRLGAYRALPVLYVRGETDSSSAVAALSTGAAMENFKQSLTNFCAAAQSLAVAPKVLAVSLDFTLEAVEDDARSWHVGMYDLMERITDLFVDHGLRKPLFVAQFEAGTQVFSDSPIIRAQWDLAWNKGGHDFVYAAPSYMFELDAFGRATATAQAQMAEMDAYAIEARNSDQDWACPIFLLAEREEDTSVIRCTAQSMNALVIDAHDPLNAGPSCGFALENCSNGAKITSVTLDPAHPNDLLIACDKPPQGEGLHLTYALGFAASCDGMPANRGALRDLWQHHSTTGDTLHRWALPAALPVH